MQRNLKRAIVGVMVKSYSATNNKYVGWILRVLTLRTNANVLFGLQNRPLEWNSYSYGIVILLFGKSLFLGIVIPVGMNNPTHKGMEYIFQKHPYFLLFYFKVKINK